MSFIMDAQVARHLEREEGGRGGIEEASLNASDIHPIRIDGAGEKDGSRISADFYCPLPIYRAMHLLTLYSFPPLRSQKDPAMRGLSVL